jgi:hypothetical protein
MVVIVTVTAGDGVAFAQMAGGDMAARNAAIADLSAANANSPYAGAPFSIGGAGSSYATSWSRATTPGEGYARGISELIRAAGSTNLALSEAAVTLTEAERRQLKNDVDFINTYFQIRRLNRELRAQERGPRPTMEDLIRFAQLGKPQRLSPGDIDAANGQIFWPIILRAEVFAPYRIKLETYFGQRVQLGGMTAESYLGLDQTARAMVEELRRYVADFPPADYLHAKHFIESLGYEAHFPLGQPVAATAAATNAPAAEQVR